MKDLFFLLKADVDAEQRESLFQRIKARPGVRAAVPLKAEAKSPRMRRQCVVRVDDDVAAATLARMLRGLDEVESVEALPARSLPDRPRTPATAGRRGS